jgi:hypothetical protein
MEDLANAAIENFDLNEDELLGANSSPMKTSNKPSLAKGASAFVPDTSYQWRGLESPQGNALVQKYGNLAPYQIPQEDRRRSRNSSPMGKSLSRSHMSRSASPA